MYSDELAIRVDKLKKIYPLFDKPIDRLKQFFWPSQLKNKRQFYKAFTALKETSFELEHGEILGIIGRNGSGKSTLLQMICGTLTPTSGDLKVNGRIAALLELGAGFNPEFTGKENIFLNASILGLSKKEITRRYDEIVEFSGVSQFINQPVKTYSSGMYMRLAFSVAVCVDPDILIIDEALSVGDGDFAKKSFDRIMQLKEQGKTILFCSHSLYQIEMLCNQVLWIESGKVKEYGKPEYVVPAYKAFLEQLSSPAEVTSNKTNEKPQNKAIKNKVVQSNHDNRIINISVLVDGKSNNKNKLLVKSQQSTLTVSIKFSVDLKLAPPVLVVVIVDVNRKIIASAFTNQDNMTVNRDKNGDGEVSVSFPNLALLKGEYGIDLGLFCDKAIFAYDHVMDFIRFEVVQESIEQGVVTLEHNWANV